MLKSILAIIVSYVALFILFMAVVTGLFFVLGVERIFQPDSYEISTLWIGLTLAVGLLATIFSGYLCAAISKSWRTCQFFALIVFLLALIQCFSELRRDQDSPNVRAARCLPVRPEPPGLSIYRYPPNQSRGSSRFGNASAI